MNIAVRNLTPTQQAARERHLRFTASITEKAQALAKSKMESAVKEMARAFKTEARTLQPEDVPAEIERPKAPAGTHWFGPTDREDAFTLRNYPRIEDIQRAIAKHFKITRLDLCSQRRSLEIARPRQIGYYLSRKLTPRSYPDIARRFGRKDHSAIIHGINVIKGLLSKDTALAHDVTFLIEQITGIQQ